MTARVCATSSKQQAKSLMISLSLPSCQELATWKIITARSKNGQQIATPVNMCIKGNLKH